MGGWGNLEHFYNLVPQVSEQQAKMARNSLNQVSVWADIL
jgi:hypothetical protein